MEYCKKKQLPLLAVYKTLPKGFVKLVFNENLALESHKLNYLLMGHYHFSE